jgi:fructose-bisphosphate aldolase class II
MALISLRQLLDHAAEFNYGVPAFNVNNLEQIQAIMEAAEDARSPVILQASAGARKYAGEPYRWSCTRITEPVRPYAPNRFVLVSRA